MSTGVHRLVTGLPGHGKTLYTVSEILRPLVGTKLQREGLPDVERRLCVSGIRDLALVHEPFECPANIDWATWKDEHRAVVREPGEPAALPDGVTASITNWWLWVQPGDVVVIDECQRAFRPAPAGRPVPMFISNLERARHYGVQFVFITQAPGLLHSNVRNLVGPHQNVARVWGRSATFVYTWDHCSNPDRIKSAQAKLWKHPKDAFKLYKSAEVHTKFATPIPVVAYLLVAAVLCFPVLGGWWYWKRGKAQELAQAPAQAAAAGQPVGQVPPGQVVAATWPVLNVGAKKTREPFADRGIHLMGSFESAGVRRSWYTISVSGRPVATLSDQQMAQAGYAVRWVAPCSVVVTFGDLGERAVTCDAPIPLERPQDRQVQQAAAPAPPASGPRV